jgi:ribonuclease D
MHRQDLQTNSDSTETESFDKSNLNTGEIINSEIDQRFPERLSKEHIKTLPILSFEGKIHLITESKDVSEAIKILRKASVLGFDTETRPSFKKGEQYSVSLLQLSTRDEAFLFRLNYLGFPKELVSLLADPDIKKVGVAILDDIRALRKLRKFDAQGFVELSNIGSELGIVTCGLRNLAAIFFGVRISKKEQLTNWERPDLNPSQCLYAATDAWICLKMFCYLDSEKVLPEKIIWKMPEPQPRKSSRRLKNKQSEQKK